MLFDFFMSPVGSWADLPREAVTDILYRGAIEPSNEWGVRYADGSGAREISGLEDWDQEGGKKRSLCFRRFGGPMMARRIYEMADRLDAMMFWPGEAPFIVVTRQDLFDRLDPAIDRAFAAVVRDADHLVACITS